MKTNVFPSKFIPVLFFFVFLFIFTNTTHGQDVDDDFYFTEDEGITIFGTVQTSQQIDVIGKEEIERRGASDLADLLQEALGLNIVRNGAYGNEVKIVLRGLDSKRIAFLVNGVPANSSFDGKFDINQIDLDSIERIEVIHGGSDTKFNVSGAMGGVINIVTARKQNPGWGVAASVSNTSAMPNEFFDTQNYSLSAAYGGGIFSFSANTFFNNTQNHFQYKDYFGQSRRREKNEVWDTGAAVSAIWELPDLTKLITSANFYYGDKNIPNTFSQSGVDKQGETAASLSFLVDAPAAFHDNLATEASLTWHYNRRSYEGDFDDSLHNQNSFLAVNRRIWYLNDRVTLRSGIDYRFIFLTSTDMNTRSRHDGGLYLTAEFKPIKSFLIIPSAKVVFSSIGTEKITVVPKLGLLWNITESLALKNNYFRSFKFPDFEELFFDYGYGMTGNPNLRPEDGWGADIGADWSINKYVQMQSVFFTQWLIDSIHWDNKSGTWRPENAGEAIFFGFDTKISFEIPVPAGPIEKIIPSLSYKYLLSFMLDGGRTFSSNVRVPYSPEHTFGFLLDILWKTGSFLISGHFESKRFHTDNSAVLAPYFLLNADINQKFGKNITAFINLRNMLNWSYRSFYGSPPDQDYPMPGFMFTLGMRVRI